VEPSSEAVVRSRNYAPLSGRQKIGAAKRARGIGRLHGGEASAQELIQPERPAACPATNFLAPDSSRAVEDPFASTIGALEADGALATSDHFEGRAVPIIASPHPATARRCRG
jgi:hypothetical protein